MPGHRRQRSPTRHRASPATDPQGLLQHVLRNIADGVVVADMEGRFIHVNPAAREILALGPLDVGQTAWAASHGCFGEDGTTPVAEAALPLSRAIRGETVYDQVLFVRGGPRAGGAWISVNASPLRDETGAVCGGVAVFRDVGAKREEFERVRMLSTVVEQTADAVIVTDRNGVIEYVNPATCRITGFSEGELIGQTPRLLRSGAHEFAFYQVMWATLEAGEVFRGTIINRKKDGDLYHSEQTITPIRNGAGVIYRFVSVGKDVTELRKAAEQATRLSVARSVQQRLYPRSPLPGCGFDMAGAAFLADRTGGDYYDFIQLPDGWMGAVLGDVSGHGIDAALVMAETRAYLRSAAQAHSDPGELLSRVNSVLVNDIEDNQFVTMVVACLSRDSRVLRYASAGQTTGYVLDAAGVPKAQLPSTGPPLGILQQASIATAETPCLAPGDVAVFFTDGVIEAEDAGGRLFGSDRALEAVAESRHEPASRIVHHLYRAVRQFTGPLPQADDITAVVCKVAR